MVYQLVLLISLVFSQFAFAIDTLFEGYYKISSGDQHIGYSIVRYQFDSKAKKFHAQQMTRMNSGGTDVMESTVAVSDDTMNPVSYKYTSLVGKNSKTIDAKFTKGKMTATVTETGKKNVSIKNDIKPGTFLSLFLTYTILRSPTGIQTNSNYDYSAIAEEDGQIETGKASVKKEEKYKGFNSFKIENTFKKSTFISYVTDKGEALATEVKDARIVSELVAKPGDAIGTIGMPESVAKTVFGSVPKGDKNVVTNYFNSMEKGKDADTKTGKQYSVPPGQGIQLKAAPQKKEGS